MVHIYTIGYMQDDPGYNRFFSYISLFTFSMLMLVMSNNFMQLFFGWEAVGLVSYLLIGFWYTRPTAIFANMKAFLVNRVGDFGFILGIGLVLSHFGTLDYAAVFAKSSALAATTIPLFGEGSDGGADERRFASCCSSVPWASRHRCRCMSGCPTRWKARRRFRR
jgi:NADH-quinone oxidoreductase subunit L